MARPFDAGTPALYKYQEVKYFHFQVAPGVSYVLSTDPFSFLRSWLGQHIPRKRAKNRSCLKRALYYTELAEEFYNAAARSAFPAKGTLAYYGMLNLVKSYLSVRHVELETEWEHHGLTLPPGKQRTIRVGNTSSGISIFSEFAILLGCRVAATKALLPLDQIVSNIPELHEMAFTLDVLPWKKRKYLPVEIDFLVNRDKTKLFTELRYEKKHEARVDTGQFHKGDRKNYFVRRAEEDGWIIFRSKRKKSVNQRNFPNIYRNIQTEYDSLGLSSILTRRGYRYYCDLRPDRLHQLCNSLAFLFYLGSIARYRPSEVEDIKADKIGPLVNEALAVIPQQFLYQLVSMITASVCVVPESKLD